MVHMNMNTPLKAGRGEAEIEDADGEIVALVCSMPSPRVAIIRAVNAHDALVAALRLARETLYKMPALGEREIQLRAGTNKQINAALKLAEGEGV